MGSWNPKQPNGQETPLERKCVDSSMESVLVTTNLGESWSVGGTGLDTTLNEASTIIGTNEYVMDYTAFAKQTKVANNEPVFNGEAGLGSVTCTASSKVLQGCLFAEGLIGQVNVGAAGWNNSELPLTQFLFNLTGELQSTGLGTGLKHGEVPLYLSNDSGGIKALNYQVESNQQVNINYSYEELIYDVDWGDDMKLRPIDGQTTNTDDNGNTVLCGTATLAIPYGWVKNEV